MQNIPKTCLNQPQQMPAMQKKISKRAFPLKDAMLRFRSNKLAMVGLVIIVLIILMAILRQCSQDTIIQLLIS